MSNSKAFTILQQLTPTEIQAFTEAQCSYQIGLRLALTPEECQQCEQHLALLRKRRSFLKQRRQYLQRMRLQYLVYKTSLLSSRKPSSNIKIKNVDGNALCQKKGQSNRIKLRFNQCISSAFQRVGSLLLKPFSKNAQEQKTSKPLVQQEEETLLLAREPEESISSDPVNLKQKKIK